MIQEHVRILLVEDDGDDYVITKSLLSEIKGHQFHLDWANSFDKGLALMVRNKHDVYLIDYRLGSHDGIELLRCAIEGGCQSPIILLTGQNEHEIDLAAMESGAADYLIKTQLTSEDIERSIRYALERNRTVAIAAYEHARLAAFGAEIGLALTQRESMQITLKRCAELILRYLNAARAEIWVYDKEHHALEPWAAAGACPTSTCSPESAITTSVMGALLRGEPLLVRSVTGDARFADQPWLKAEGITCYAAHPLVLENGLIGLMSIYSQAPLADSVLTEMASVANGIALCIERHRSKNALDASEVKYRTVVENIKEVIFQMDEFGNWTFLNPAWEAMTGFKLSETIGTLFTQYIQADDRDNSRHVFIQLVERKLDYSRHEARYITKDGQIRWIDAYMQLLVDREGMVLGVTGTLTDVTERRQTEVQIQKLAAFPRFNPNPVLEFAADGTLTYANDAANEMASALGKEHPISILPANAGEIAMECLACGQNKLRAETVINEKTISWSFFPIVGGRVVHCYGVDISERLSLEAQFRHAQKLESVGQLAAGIAHDFNNILTVIQGHADLILAQAGNSETTAGQLKQISSAAQRAASLTRQLLMFSRKQVLQTKLIDLNAVLRGLAKMLPRLLGENITLNIRCGEGTFQIEADVGMIEQVLMNLAVNARDAMPKGGELTLTTKVIEIDEANKPTCPESRVGRFVCLTVTDTGCGMSRETLDRIFEPFFTTKEVGKGTGLGLATAFGIIKQHLGWIEVSSEPNLGTAFNIFVPASSKGQIIHEDAGEPVGVRQGGNETILLVEDEPTLRAMVNESLKDHGYQVLQATHGIEAMEVYDAHDDSIDLVLTDVVMPQGMTGYELGNRIKARKPDIKVIYTSGYTAGIVGSEVVAADQTFLAKPYSLNHLSRLVRECLDK